MQATLRQSLRLVGFLTIPSTLGLVALGEPIIRLLYQHGRFTSADTHATALALLYYSVGLFAYSAVKVFAPAFYALDRPRVPLIGSVMSVTTNLVLNIALYPYLGYKGVALGTSAGAIVNCSVLAVAFQRTVGGVRGGGLPGALAKISLAALVMGGCAYGAAVLLEQVFGTHGGLAKIVTCVAPIGVGVLVYAVGARLLHIEEMKDIMALVKRRLRRR
jgi:putative peptidoglycan lipid II flippase